MIINGHNRRRGSMIYGLAAITLFIGVLCAVCMDRALDIYRISAQEEYKLSALAAAEGAAIVAPKDGGEFQIGRCAVKCLPMTADGAGMQSAVQVDVMANGRDSVVWNVAYIAHYSVTADGATVLKGLSR